MRHAKKLRPWSYKAGEKGRNRVRVFEDAARGVIFAEVIERHPVTGIRAKRRLTLGHGDRERAKGEAERMASALRESEQLPASVTTLGAVCQSYLEHVTPTKGRQKQKHDRAAVALFLRCFGAERRAADLDARDWRRFIEARATGELRPNLKKKARAVGVRMITYDLKALRAILTWATIVKDGGRRWLDRNPLEGLPYPSGDPVARPVLSQAEYTALLAVAPRVNPLFELALILAHETGHRGASIRLLRWSDVRLSDDPAECSIRWRAENDKSDFEHVTPLTEPAVVALRAAQRATAAIGDTWVFPHGTEAGAPCSRYRFNTWWTRGVTLAKLEKASRRGWHSLRRKWATETKAMPLKDQAHAGGWKSTKVLLDVYQRADWETMREGLAKRAPIRQVAR